jgi:formamidopyrimidine-DNA glycosylase
MSSRTSSPPSFDVPELIEVESYRRQAEAAVGRTIVDAPVLDPFGLRHADPEEVRGALAGVTVERARRIGKLLLLDTDGPVIGLRFGMTGRLLVDDASSISGLLYGGSGDDPGWDRFVLTFADGGDLRIRDPRRLGGLEVDPDEAQLGPEAATLTTGQLADALRGSRTTLKARLLDQRRVAGLGNLLVDESLWRAGIDPARPAGGLDRAEQRRLARTVTSTVADLTARGGSHTGDLQPARHRGATCPRDGAPLDRRTVGGRTTYSCPRHQR